MLENDFDQLGSYCNICVSAVNWLETVNSKLKSYSWWQGGFRLTAEADNDNIDVDISVKSTMNHWRWWHWWWLFYSLRIKKIMEIAWMRKYWLRTLVSCTRSWISLLSWLLPIPWWYQRSHHLQKGGFFVKKINEIVIPLI